MKLAPGSSQPANDMAVMQQNLGNRAALLQSAPPMRKALGTFTGGTPGGTTRLKLFNVGITTKICLDITMTVDIGVVPATPSPKAPFNLINRVKLTDFDGTDRVNCSGYQLWVLNSNRRRTPYGYNNGSLTAVSTLPVVPTAVANTQQFRFMIEVPLAYDPKSDLRGALLTQTAVGEAWLNIDWNNLLVSNANANAVYNGGATSTVALSAGTTISVTAYQEYLLPQDIGGSVPMPMLDLMTVYEINGAVTTNDNIANGQEKLISYPNLRSVIGFYFNFVNNGVMNPATTDISTFRLIANGNNVLREYGNADKLFQQRLEMVEGADLRVGTYFENHRIKPIETALFGNVQYGITPSSVSGTNTGIEFCFESFYTKGSMLPGMMQSG